MRNLLLSFSGCHNERYLNIAVFFTVFVFGLLEKIGKSQDIKIIIAYSVLFSTLTILNLFIKHYSIDIASDLILTASIMFFTPYGNLTAVLFLIFIIYNSKNKYQYYALGSISLILIVLSALSQKVSPVQIVVILIGYFFLIGKYIYTIHIPTIKLKKENERLKTSLSIVGNAKHLTEDQILYHYPVMSHHDYDRKYSKINIIRDFSDGVTRTKLAKKYDCSERSIDRYLSEMKEEFGKLLGIKITENTHLVKIAAMLDIIQVIVRQKEY